MNYSSLVKNLMISTLMSAPVSGSSLITKTNNPIKQIFDQKIEIKGGYFFFLNSKYNDIFSNGGYSIQMAYNTETWKTLALYAALGYQHASGRSLYGKDRTTFQNVPLDLGVKSIQKISRKIGYYISIGPRYFFVQQHNYSNDVDSCIFKNGLGFYANTGFDFYSKDNLNLGVFSEYSYQKSNYHPSKRSTFGRDIQIGGMVFGASLGYRF